MRPQRALMTCLWLWVLSPLAACTTAVTAATQAAASPATGRRVYALRPGQQLTLAGEGSLRYVRLVNDSRCAPDVQCIWAGDAEIAFAWTPARAASQTFSLHTGRDPRQQRLGARLVTLVLLARGPAPQAMLRVEPAPP